MYSPKYVDYLDKMRIESAFYNPKSKPKTWVGIIPFPQRGMGGSIIFGAKMQKAYARNWLIRSEHNGGREKSLPPPRLLFLWCFFAFLAARSFFWLKTGYQSKGRKCDCRFYVGTRRNFDWYGQPRLDDGRTELREHFTIRRVHSSGYLSIRSRMKR